MIGVVVRGPAVRQGPVALAIPVVVCHADRLEPTQILVDWQILTEWHWVFLPNAPEWRILLASRYRFCQNLLSIVEASANGNDRV